MSDKEKVFEDLKTLVKMCRSKSDGASLRIEEEEINSKIAEYNSEIDDIKYSIDDESYDSASEMADRNIEIILKKAIQSLKNELKIKNNELANLKEQEHDTNVKISIVKDAIKKNNEYIESINNRIKENTNEEIKTRYERLLEEAQKELASQTIELEQLTNKYSEIQNFILRLTQMISELEDKISKKTTQLEETQYNLQNKEVYVDQGKRERSLKKIHDIEAKIAKLVEKLNEIHQNPKYLETKIAEIITNNEDNFEARPYLLSLINQAKSIPYMEVNADNSLEDELLRATQARDVFANEIDHKKYNVLDTTNPQQIRIEFLKARINKWQNNITELEGKASSIDNDQEFNYFEKNNKLTDIIDSLKQEYNKYLTEYENEPEINISTKASLKVALDDTKEALNEAEKIAVLLKQDETDDINEANYIVNKQIAELKEKINAAQTEIADINKNLTTKKAGMVDINAQAKDKEKLKELATTVINIKHRRQFAEKPSEIAARLEQTLGISLNENSPALENTETSQTTQIPEVENLSPAAEISNVDVSPILTTPLEEPAPTNIDNNINNEFKTFINNLETTVE